MKGHIKAILTLLSAVLIFSSAQNKIYERKAAAVLKQQILEETLWALQQQPITVTAETSARSTGGKHDFYSEGDYWWPDPDNPSGPYIRRDGLTNPDNFTAHRKAMIRFSKIIGALASAYKLTGNEKYVKHALIHLKAWFIDTETLMNPNLLYAQAVQGRFTGRGIGIIDTIHLMEAAQGVLCMQGAASMDEQTLKGIRNWFEVYLKWLTTHPYGIAEMNAENNHGTCWVMQTASFAKLTGNDTLLQFCRERYKTVLLPSQMTADGSFPKELSRTKPYGYSIFNLDAMAMICQILSNKKDNLWAFETPDGKSIRKGIAFLYPYTADKSKWPFPKDVMYWDYWPAAQPFLLFGANAYHQKAWFQTWERLDHKPENEEIIRNLPVRHPLIWFD